jgi:predicted amidophosphoribosyltransferase
LEVRTADAPEALRILERDHRQSTGLLHHDLSCAGIIFDADATTTVCPACGATFAPGGVTTCPGCGLNFS